MPKGKRERHNLPPPQNRIPVLHCRSCDAIPEVRYLARMPPTDVSPSGRIFGLDLFRAVAIILVVMRHGGIVLGLDGIGSPAGLK